MSLKEVTHPKYGGHIFMHSDHLSFRRACSVDSLSFCVAVNHAFSKGVVCASVTSHVAMNGKCCIDEPILLVQIHSLKC